MAQDDAATLPSKGTGDGNCRLAELVQYSCERVDNTDGDHKLRCFPLPRIFRICPGRPAVELTRYVNVDMNTGEVEIPSTLNHQLPRAKPWRDIIRYKSASDGSDS